MNKLNAIIIGDYSHATYHPFQGIDSILTNLLSESFTVKCTEDRDELKFDNLKRYALCISYVDAWEKQLLPDQVQGLCRFVAEGGGFLSIHNGISYQNTPEFANLVGAKFTSHPPYQKLTYSTTYHSHPITEGIDDFEMEEELYLFDMMNPSELTFLLQSTDGTTISPALWTKTYGNGRVAFLAPGHDKHSFSNTTFLKLIERCAKWASRMLLY